MTCIIYSTPLLKLPCRITSRIYHFLGSLSRNQTLNPVWILLLSYTGPRETRLPSLAILRLYPWVLFMLIFSFTFSDEARFTAAQETLLAGLWDFLINYYCSLQYQWQIDHSKFVVIIEPMNSWFHIKVDDFVVSSSLLNVSSWFVLK